MGSVASEEGQTVEEGSEESREEEVQVDITKKKVPSLRVSTDWRSENKAPAPALTVDSLLRYTNEVVNYTETPPKITVEKIPVPSGWVIHNILTPDECKQYIDISEKMVYEASPLRNLDTVNSNSFTLDAATTSIRTSQRVLFDVPDHIGLELNKRIHPHLPEKLTIDDVVWCRQELGGGYSGGPLNKRWRFNKYSPGQFFKPHYDAGYVYTPNEKTILTFILYLNEGFVGGETTFFPGNKRHWHTPAEPGIEYACVPKTGSALIFQQIGRENPRHEGTPHTSEGQFKYILRSDVTYFREDPI
jgi:hypothetical protein